MLLFHLLLRPPLQLAAAEAAGVELVRVEQAQQPDKPEHRQDKARRAVADAAVVVGVTAVVALVEPQLLHLLRPLCSSPIFGLPAD